MSRRVEHADVTGVPSVRLTSPPSWLLDDARVVHRQLRPAAAGQFAAWPPWLPEDVRASIEASGITAPYQHQRDVADLAVAGEHVAISTPTASGKSLAYWLPVLAATAAAEPYLGAWQTRRASLGVPRPTAVYLAPTKALAHDQVRAVKALAPAGFLAAALDGDSGDEQRRLARHHARLVLTNPDMLHHSVLPQHARWSRLLGNLRYLVIDEAHRYHGVFGAHVAQVIRRLRRLCQHYGSDPTVILASATARELGHTSGLLIGSDRVAVVDTDSAPHGAREVVLWQPTNLTGDAAEVLAKLVDDRRQSIAFVGSRTMAEVIASKARELSAHPGLIASYRAGYLADDRRALEAALHSGELRGVAATTALEVGVDVSGMDAVVIAGFPGSMAALWQQAGRAGRGQRDATVVLMAREDPLDQYLLSHPELIFDSPVERVVLHPENTHVLGPHLVAAAAEAPITEADELWFGPSTVRVADALAAQGVLKRRATGWYWTRGSRPTDRIDLRTMGGQSLDIVDVDTGRVIGQVDPGAADRTVHVGAVYLHQGEQFVVEDYTPDEHVAMVRAARPGYWTQALGSTQVSIVATEQSRAWGRGRVYRGEIELITQVTGYLRRDEVTSKVWDETPLDLPEHRMTTRAVWLTVPSEVADELGFSAVTLAAAAHAAQHTALAMLPVFVPSDRGDVGGTSTLMHPDTGACTVVIYDTHPGGAGWADQAFEVVDRWLAATTHRLSACACQNGCPACVVSAQCARGNQALNKGGAEELLRALAR